MVDCSLKKNKNNKRCKFIGDSQPRDFPSHSFRNFGVGSQFKESIKKCNQRDVLKAGECRSNVRAIHRFAESGRLSEMGDKIHDFVVRLDPDEVKTFKQEFPGATKIANEFASVEDLREF